MQPFTGLPLLIAIALASSACTPLHVAPSPSDHADHASHRAPVADDRQLVRFPDPMRVQTLANMRDHLLAIGQIQQSLSTGDFDRASEIAERRLGLSSLESHGAHDVGKLMPLAMQQAGTAMHRSASRLATITRDASVSGDLRPALSALSDLTATCVGCHARFRLQ